MKPLHDFQFNSILLLGLCGPVPVLKLVFLLFAFGRLLALGGVPVLGEVCAQRLAVLVEAEGVEGP